MADYRVVHWKKARRFYIEQKTGIFGIWKPLTDHKENRIKFRTLKEAKEEIRRISGNYQKEKEVVYKVSV